MGLRRENRLGGFMDLLLEFIIEFILEMAVEGTKSSKIPKWIRFLLGSILLGGYLLLFGLIIYIAIVNRTQNKQLSSLLITISIVLILFLILDARKVYKEIKKRKEENKK